MLNKWFEIIFNHKITLRERMFRVVTSICMIALLIILPMGRNITNLLILAASLVCMAAVVKISIKKKCINAGATIITVLLLLLFPLSFFTAGGFYSGMPEWFVLCFIYISITLKRKRKAFFFPVLYGGDTALLLPRLPFSGAGGAEQQIAFVLRFRILRHSCRHTDQRAAYVPEPTLRRGERTGQTAEERD